MTDCFHCGDDTHLSYDCPRHTSPRPTPVSAPGLPPAPEHHPASWTENIGTLRVPPSHVADPTRWSEHIRDAMHWSPDHQEQLLRAAAARQVAEARRGHAHLPEFGASHAVAPSTAPAVRPLPRWTPLPDDPPGLRAELTRLSAQ
jgi:hypothetical protein